MTWVQVWVTGWADSRSWVRLSIADANNPLPAVGSRAQHAVRCAPSARCEPYSTLSLGCSMVDLREL